MSFELYVARRYLTARRRQALISLISAVSIVGVAVGVMALVIALALMTGVQAELRDRIVGSQAHIYVFKLMGTFDDLDADVKPLMVPGVAGAAPAVTGVGLIEAPGADITPVTLKGIDTARESAVTDMDAAIAAGAGSLGALASRPPDAFDGVILGADLASSLGVRVGDRVVLWGPQPTLTPQGLGPRRRPLEVVAVAKFGFYQADSTSAFVTLDTALSMLGRDAPDMMQLKVADLDAAPAIRQVLADRLGSEYAVQDWTELNRPLYSALWLEKVAISLTIGLIVMVAALNIVASLVLLVMEKSRDIAILRTMGASARSIRKIFVYQGLTIGLIGTGAGTILGLIICFVLDYFKLIRLDAEVYQITFIPFRVQPGDLLIVMASAVLVCLIATIYPSRQAGRLDPAEALRHQ
jgi:lipoprotein-releasing system permease protein